MTCLVQKLFNIIKIDLFSILNNYYNNEKKNVGPKDLRK